MGEPQHLEGLPPCGRASLEVTEGVQLEAQEGVVVAGVGQTEERDHGLEEEEEEEDQDRGEGLMRVLHDHGLLLAGGVTSSKQHHA